jgi:glycine reductase
MSLLANKKIIIIGDRDGIPGQAIEECVKTAGGEIVFSSTECFVNIPCILFVFSHFKPPVWFYCLIDCSCKALSLQRNHLHLLHKKIDVPTLFTELYTGRGDHRSFI